MSAVLPGRGQNKMALSKHINFFELEKASEQPGCPLCVIIEKRAEQYLDNMLFEHISDRPFRAKYKASGGFCAFHSRGLESFRDGLAVAILGRDILEERIKSYESMERWAPKGRCPVCEERDKIEEEYLSFLAEADGESKEEEELKRIFCAGDGLCAPHYSSLLFAHNHHHHRNHDHHHDDHDNHRYFYHRKKRRIPAWLKEFHEAKFNDLKKRVDNFIELSAYGRQKEFALLSVKDQLVWKELAVALREID